MAEPDTLPDDDFDDDDWDDDDGFDDDDFVCPRCEGTGSSWDGLCECLFCNGDGYL